MLWINCPSFPATGTLAIPNNAPFKISYTRSSLLNSFLPIHTHQRYSAKPILPPTTPLAISHK